MGKKKCVEKTVSKGLFSFSCSSFEGNMSSFGFPILEKYFWFSLCKIFSLPCFQIDWPNTNNRFFHPCLCRQRDCPGSLCFNEGIFFAFIQTDSPLCSIRRAAVLFIV